MENHVHTYSFEMIKMKKYISFFIVKPACFIYDENCWLLRIVMLLRKGTALFVLRRAFVLVLNLNFIYLKWIPHGYNIGHKVVSIC